MVGSSLRNRDYWVVRFDQREKLPALEMALGQCKAKGSQTPFEVNKMPTTPPKTGNPQSWDHSSHREFVDYYARQSLEPETVERFIRVRDKAIALLAQCPEIRVSLQVAGHRMRRRHTVSPVGAIGAPRSWTGCSRVPSIEVAKQRAQDDHLEIEFAVGSATELPYADKTMMSASCPNYWSMWLTGRAS